MLVVCISSQTWWYELPSPFPVTLQAAVTPDVSAVSFFFVERELY
jgi:hypothetical protein